MFLRLVSGVTVMGLSMVLIPSNYALMISLDAWKHKLLVGYWCVFVLNMAEHQLLISGILVCVFEVDKWCQSL